MTKKKDDSILLSEEHGVNPTIIKCIWCGGDKGLALLGKLPGDVQAPKECVMDYDPCDKCQEDWNHGVPIIEVSQIPKQVGQPPIAQNPTVYPTGCVLVMPLEGLTADHPYEKGAPVLCTTEDFQEIIKELPQEKVTTIDHTKKEEKSNVVNFPDVLPNPKLN